MRTTIFLSFGLAFSALASAIGCDPGGPAIPSGVGGSVGSGGDVAGGGGVGAGGASSGGGPAAGGGSSAGGGPAAGGSASGGGPAGSGGAGSGGGPTDPRLQPAKVTAGTCQADLGGYQNGSVTYYWFDQGTQQVNCGNPELGRNPDRLEYVDTNNGNYFGAMNTADYDTAATCGACVEITRDGGRKVTITIADRCPIESNNKCKTGHIDLSREAFDQIGNRGNEGYVGQSNGGDVGQISWKYVPCPDGSTVVFTLKEPDNAYWNQVMVSGHRWAIEKVEVLIAGEWVNTTRQIHNYWEPPARPEPEGNFGDELPYRVRVTDVNGAVLEAPVQLAAGPQDSGLQFSCN